jgi:hypothetical protein
MQDKNQYTSRRSRALLGAGVVALSLVIAVTLAGFSFAAGGGQLTPAASQYGPSKITICHHTRSLKKPVVTLKISTSAWKAHRKHGDTLGRCTAAQIKKAKKIAHAKLVKAKKAKLAKAKAAKAKKHGKK